MTLKNAVTKGVKAWRDRRVGYWLCIDPKTGEYHLLTSAALAELNGLKAMYRLPAVYYRAVLTRDWKVKLGPHVIGTHLDTSAYIKDWLLHSPDPGRPRHHRKGRKRGFRRRGVSAGCGSGTQGDRINRDVFWHGTKRPNFRFRGRMGPLRSRIRVLPPRDPPGDGGRRERNYTHFKLSKLCALKR